jgi:hypothetical protein
MWFLFTIHQIEDFLFIFLIDRKGKNWVHVSCALWVPEVGFGSVERMEPIIKLENVPVSTMIPNKHFYE